MKIIKNYFDQIQKEIKTVEKEYQEICQQKKPDGFSGKEHIDNVMQKIIQKAEESGKEMYVIPNNIKRQIFQEIAKDALFIAKQMFLNIVIDTDDPACGKIVLSSDCFFSSDAEEQNLQVYLGKLFIYSNDFWIDSSDGKIRLNFWYYLRDEIKVEL